jgi:CheY-like chemotaxis protein
MEEKTQELLMAKVRQNTETNRQVEVFEAQKSALLSNVVDSPPLLGVSVLLVDDNNINLNLLATFMKKQRHAYDTATNGLEAIQAYQAQFDPTRLPEKSENSLLLQNSSKLTAQSFDFVLMDLNMPLMDVSTETHDFDHTLELELTDIYRVLNRLVTFELSSEQKDCAPQSLSRSPACHLQVYSKKHLPVELTSL